MSEHAQTGLSRCQYCTGELGEESTTLDIRIIDPVDAEWRGYYARYHMCSEACRDEARRDQDWMTDGDVQHLETVHKSEVEV